MKRRTALFMPGNNASMILNAGIHGADGIILDLEDAVAPGEKDAARIMVRNALKTMKYSCEILVRINGLSTAFWKPDLNYIVPYAPDALVIPKCEYTEEIKMLDDYITNIEKENNISVGSVKLMCLLESATGIKNGYEIASASSRVESIALGAIDLTYDLGTELSDDGAEMQYSRAKMLIDARAAGVYAYDTSYPDVENIEGLIKWTKFCKALGYDGRPVISPSHVNYVNEIFTPSQEEIAYAQEVLDATEEGVRQGKGAVTLHGSMLDAPHIKRARQVLELANAIKRGGRK
ncbi:MAG: HpcH/HpaI aldolase/citrate lyase family protein [Peptococcaceae bacterium]